MSEIAIVEVCCDCRSPMPDGHSGRCYKFGCSPAGFYDGDHHRGDCVASCERIEPSDEFGLD